jgi:hypothetical protein
MGFKKIGFLAGRQASVSTFSDLLVNAYAPTALTALGFNIHKRNPGFIICYSYDVTKKFTAIFVIAL